MVSSGHWSKRSISAGKVVKFSGKKHSPKRVVTVVIPVSTRQAALEHGAAAAAEAAAAQAAQRRAEEASLPPPPTHTHTNKPCGLPPL